MASTRRPNVILIHADQLRYDGLGCNGNSFAVTPNIDRLAASGANFRRHIAANPVCMPSRASLMTGRYPSGHGLWHNGVPLPRETYVHYDPGQSGINQRPHERQIISNVPTMPDAFGQAGYETRAIGKLHLSPTGADPWYGYEESRVRWERGELDDWHGPYYGFDHVDLTIGHGEGTIGHYRTWLESTYPEVARNVDEKTHRKILEFPELPSLYRSVIPVEAHHSTWIADRATTFINERDAESDPYFLFLGFPDPHHPFSPPAELAREFESHEVLPPVFSDDEVDTKPSVMADLINGPNQRLSTRGWDPACVTRARQYTDALIHLIDLSVGSVLDALVASGGAEDTIVIFTSDHGDYLGDHQLIMKDTVCSDTLVHVPFIMRAPGQDLPSETSIPMSNTDVLPTLCELTGIDCPRDVQGSSILPALSGQTPRMVQVYGYQHEASQHNFTIYDERFRFTWYPATQERELYDHEADPHELVNLTGQPDFATEEEQLLASLAELHLRHDNPTGGRIARF